MKLIPVLLGIGCALMLGCSSTHEVAVPPADNEEATALHADLQTETLRYYRRPDTAGLHSYNRLLINPIYFNNIDDLSQREAVYLQTWFRSQLARELRRSGYFIVATPGPRTLQLDIEVSGIAPSGPAAYYGLRMGTVSREAGTIWITGYFRQPHNDRLDALLAARSSGQRALNPAPAATRYTYRRALERWASALRRALEQATKPRSARR